MKTVIGVFDENSRAERAIEDLERAGAPAGSISVLSSKEDIGDLAEVHLEPLEVQGYGRLAASGPLTTYLTQSSAREAPDAIIHALVRMGLPQSYAQSYVDAVRRGYTLEAVAVEDDKATEALSIMRSHASDLGARGGPAGGERIADVTGDVIPVIVEELEIGKREVGTGGVRVTSRIEETPVEEEVTLRTERVDVERRAVDRPLGAGEEAFKERTVEVVATSEQPVVAKRARVIEEIVVSKDIGTTTETIRDTLRSTAVDVQRMGEFDLSKYQQHFKSELAGDKEYDFESYAPAYRFGHEMRRDARFSGKEWSEVETSARTAWEEKNPGTWDRFKIAVKHAWERVKTA